MAGYEIGALSVIAILVLVYAGMYVPVALALISFAVVWVVRGDAGIAVHLLTLTAEKSIANYIFAVIPLFVLMGLLVSAADLGADCFKVANQLFRRLRGGLGIATVVANAGFAAITGISIASAAVFTRVAVPEMLRYGYTPRFSVGVVAGSSVLGMLIPPSLLLILYAVLTEQSVGDMFLAAVVPGVMLALVFCVLIVLLAKFRPGSVEHTRTVGATIAAPEEVLSLSRLAALVMPIVVLAILVIGGIYGGVFTATEAGAVGALGALVLALAKRKLTWRRFWRSLVETGHITASICILVIAASMYSRMLGLSGVPTELGAWVSAQNLGFHATIAVFVVLVLLLGTVLDAVSIMLITIPLFLPLLNIFGADLVWFGVLTVILVEIGLLTPPLGISAFVIKSTLNDERISLSDIFIGALPFAGGMLAVVIILILEPSLTRLLVD